MARERALAAPRRPGMVRWYDPALLLSTGVDVFISTALGQRADYRTLVGFGRPQGVFDYRRAGGEPRRELWFDYLADTGDGWDATHAMACLVSEPSLECGDRRLPRGDFLLLGGDEVYPSASRVAYRDRLVDPFETAFPHSAVSPHLYAIPGNHDWYDGLVSFARRFMQGRYLGGWRTQQQRSYFALRLPHRWWLWAVDIQLESDIDVDQLEYFRHVASGLDDPLREGDRVILATAEPDWLYRDIQDPLAESNLGFLEKRIIEPAGATVHVWIAGDAHHYRRHEDASDPRFQRITSGGGGAYLSPTHAPLIGAGATALKRTVRVGERTFRQLRTYPSPATSWRLSLLNLLFLVKNWKFGLLTGVAYATLTWGSWSSDSLMDVARTTLEAHPARLLWILAVLAAFVFYADRGFPVFRWIGGPAHGLAHLACAFAIAGATASVCGLDGPGPALCRLGGNFAAGAVVGPVVMGLYLLLASNVFGAHADHAFAALRIAGFKHFLRCHIRADGVLEIFPIAMPRTPPARTATAQYMLIEGPLTIDPGAPAPPRAR
jgi:hypothetical protein